MNKLRFYPFKALNEEYKSRGLTGGFLISFQMLLLSLFLFFNKNHKKSKKPVMKKADIIRAEVNKKNAEKIIKDDLNRLEFLFNNKDINNPFKIIGSVRRILASKP